MNNELEQRIRDAINARVDAEVGARRPPPPFDPAKAAEVRPLRRRPGPWVLPLLAAACVAAVVAAGVGLTSALSQHPTAPARSPAPSRPVTTPSTPTSSAPASRVDTSSTSAPQVSHTRTRTTKHARPPSPHVVDLGGARISLPHGWVARDYARYEPSGSGPQSPPAWCLTPATQPVSTAVRGCPVQLHVIGNVTGNFVDSNVEGGMSSNPEYCGQTLHNVTHEQSEDRTFGGRAADWRRWEINCSSGTNWLIEQYVVPTVPGYILFSDRADDVVHAAMTAIAAHSTLPAQTLALRLCDEGYVRSITHTSAGDRITLDRIAYRDGTVVDDNPQTYEYVIPAALLAGRSALSTGQLIYVATDGHHVVDIEWR